MKNDDDEDPSFSGLSSPTLTTHLHSEENEPFRYTKIQITLVVDISESKFYMKNTQETIARLNGITFKTILLFKYFTHIFLDIQEINMTPGYFSFFPGFQIF
ncbi:hypothetical protein I4U23_030804 [Adineta vaga]|nr:hypothetical protein I4U23_030804 [Adineta vaga]